MFKIIIEEIIEVEQQTRTVTSKIYSQKVQELDLKAVINAVNNPPTKVGAGQFIKLNLEK